MKEKIKVRTGMFFIFSYLLISMMFVKYLQTIFSPLTFMFAVGMFVVGQLVLWLVGIYG